jgi:4-amino-4-deoxy-L-arabinose transferase-like glycosyltransferase
MPEGRKRHLITLLAVILLGVALRAGYVLSLPSDRIEPDESDYVDSARGLAEDLSFDKTVYYHVPPVMPVLFAGLFSITGPSYPAARLLQCLFFIMTGVALYGLGAELAGRLGGLLAAGLGAIYPYFIFFTGYAETEALAIALIPGAILMAVRSVRSRRWPDCALFGGLLALATLTRASVMLFVLAIPLIYLIGWGVRSWRWLRASLVAATAFGCLYLPWMAVNYKYFGEIIVTPTIGSGAMLYVTALRMEIPDGAELQRYFQDNIYGRYYYPPGATHRQRLEGDRHLRQEGRRILAAHRDQVPSLLLTNLRRFWQFYPGSPGGPRTAFWYRLIGLGSYGVIFPLVLIGAVTGLRRFRELSSIYGFVAYFTLVHVALYGKLRYRIPMDGLLITLAVLGLQSAVLWLRPALWRRGERALRIPGGEAGRQRPEIQTG